MAITKSALVTIYIVNHLFTMLTNLGAGVSICMEFAYWCGKHTDRLMCYLSQASRSTIRFSPMALDSKFSTDKKVAD